MSRGRADDLARERFVRSTPNYRALNSTLLWLPRFARGDQPGEQPAARGFGIEQQSTQKTAQASEKRGPDETTREERPLALQRLLVHQRSVCSPPTALVPVHVSRNTQREGMPPN